MFKTHTCISIECNHCGEELRYDGSVPHFATEQEAADAARAYEWAVTRDGKAFCDEGMCDNARPACQCNEDEECGSGCAIDCPCPLHPEVTPVVLPGQMAIGGTADAP